MVIAVAVALVICELALRYLPIPVPTAVPDETLGYVHAPGVRRPMDDPESKRRLALEINRYGFRDGPWEPAARPTVMVVGDSFVEGLQVSKEERLTERLAQELSRHGTRWQVLNMGIGGTGPEAYIERVRTFVPIFSPEYVVVAIYNGNDLHNPNYDLQPGSSRQNYLVRNGAVIAYRDLASRWERAGWQMKMRLGQSYLMRLANDAWVKRSAATRDDAGEDMLLRTCSLSPADLANSFLIVDTLLERMHVLSGHRLIILSIPERGQLRPDLPDGCRPTVVESHLASFSRKHGIVFVPLYDRFSGLSQTPYYVGHLNPLGHRIAAEALRDAMNQLRTVNTN